MISEIQPALDAFQHPSPANLDLTLESSVFGSGQWSLVDTTVNDYSGNDAHPEDNVRHVTGAQSPDGEPQLLFRIRVDHHPTTDTPFEGLQTFTLASHHSFAPGP